MVQGKETRKEMSFFLLYNLLHDHMLHRLFDNLSVYLKKKHNIQMCELSAACAF